MCSTDVNELKIFQEHVKKAFSITVTDGVDEYLGIKITELPNGDVLLIQPQLLN